MGVPLARIRVATASVGARVEINVQSAVAVKIGHSRFRVGKPLAEIACAPQKRRRKKRVTGPAIDRAIDREKHLNEIVDAIAVHVRHRRNAAAEWHRGFL